MFTFFDTETTGLPLDYNAPVTRVDNWPRMIQIAWLSYDELGNKLSEHAYIIKPEGFTIPQQASNVHGITTEIAMEKGEDLTEILQKFAAAIAESNALVAHNISFDEKIAGAEFVRKKVASNLFGTPRLCTMKSSTDFCKIPGRNGRYKWPNLTELHTKLFGKGFENAHDALSDVIACADSFFELQKRGVRIF